MNQPVPRIPSVGFYKNTAALRMQLIPCSQDSQGYPKYGGYMLEFARGGGQSTKYDWERGTKFFLAAHEAMKFCAMLTTNRSLKFYHDPDKGREGEGSRAKGLSVGEQGTSLFLNLNAGENRYGIALLAEEIETIRVLIESTLRFCYGW